MFDINATASELYTLGKANFVIAGLIMLVITSALTYTVNKSWPFLMHWGKIGKDKWITKYNYRIIGFKKHVTAYKNGQAIIVQNIEMMLHKPEKPFKRELKVSDVPPSFALKDIRTLCSVPVQTRFHDQGMWVCSNPDGLIKTVEGIPSETTATNLVFNIVFDLDIAKRHKNKPVNIIYGYSIPKLYPIDNGTYDASYNAKNPFWTGFMVHYKMDYYTCILGLEQGVQTADAVKTIYYPNGMDHDGLPKEMEKIDDLFYNKYEVTIKRPKRNSVIKTVVKLA